MDAILPISTALVARVVGATARQVGYWVRTGLLGPSKAREVGSGRRRRYSFVDLVALMTIAELRKCGCPLQTIRRTTKYLRENYPSESEVLASLTLLTDGTKVYMLTDEHDIMEVITKQRVWSVPLGLLIQRTRQRIESLPQQWSQQVRVAGRLCHLDVIGDQSTGTFTVQCRELPGAIEQGSTVEEAVKNGKEAIRSALAFMAKHRRRGTQHVKAG